MARARHIHTLIVVGALAVLAPAAAAPSPADPPVPAAGHTSHSASDVRAARAAVRNTRFLTPRAGVRISTLRPTLRWRGLPGGTTRVNLQIFRVERGRATTVLSVFSSGRAYSVPPGRLARGHLYVWRVWAQRGRKGYTPRPVGVSFFSVAPNAR